MVLLAQTQSAADKLKAAMPVVPGIEGDFGGQPVALGDYAVAADGRCAWGFAPWPEAQQDYVLAQAEALGIGGQISFVEGLPGDWGGKEATP